MVFLFAHYRPGSVFVNFTIQFKSPTDSPLTELEQGIAGGNLGDFPVVPNSLGLLGEGNLIYFRLIFHLLNLVYRIRLDCYNRDYVGNYLLFEILYLAIKCDSNPCDDNAICEDTETGYTCSCRSGFIGDGRLCQGKKTLCEVRSFYFLRYMITRTFHLPLISFLVL